MIVLEIEEHERGLHEILNLEMEHICDALCRRVSSRFVCAPKQGPNVDECPVFQTNVLVVF